MIPNASFFRRGQRRHLDHRQATMTLLDWLRFEDRAVGTKEGCGEGGCGACTVVLARPGGDGTLQMIPVNACMLLAGQADGADVITVEDLAAADGTLHPVQAAMLAHHGSQCGFCTPGIIMSLFAQHSTAPRPFDRASVEDQLAGNLCRCTGYRPIIDAALAAAAEPPRAAPTAVSLTDLRAADTGDDLHVANSSAVFAAPRTEDALRALLAAHPDATLLAGGTDLGLGYTKALVVPEKVVWIARIAALREIATQNGALELGAAVTLADASHHLAAIAPDLGEVIRRFGSSQVRASATIGGNIANGSPIGDLAPCLIALGAELELAGPDGTRTLPLERFFIAYRRQDRRAGEYLRGVRVPLPEPSMVFRAFKISKRRDEDITIALGAFAVTIAGGCIASARIAFGGMAGTPARARATECALVGLDIADTATWRVPLDTLGAEFSPIDDHRASAGYRRTVARNMLAKLLLELSGQPASAVPGQRAAETI